MTSIQIIFLLPTFIECKKGQRIHFICIGFGENRCEAHNAAMFSCNRAITERSDVIRIKEVADFCKVGRKLYETSNDKSLRQTISIGNIIAIVCQK